MIGTTWQSAWAWAAEQRAAHEMAPRAAHQHTHSLKHTHAHTLSHTHTLTHTHTHTQTHTHTHTHTHAHTHTPSHTHSHTRTHTVGVGVGGRAARSRAAPICAPGEGARCGRPRACKGLQGFCAGKWLQEPCGKGAARGNVTRAPSKCLKVNSWCKSETKQHCRPLEMLIYVPALTFERCPVVNSVSISHNVFVISFRESTPPENCQCIVDHF